MSKKNNDEVVTFHELEWDTEFFGVTCAKAILNQPLTMAEWTELKERFKDYQFTSIENRNSDPTNAQLIGRSTSAFLADVNIQFKKNLNGHYTMPDSVKVFQRLERNDRVLEIADFKFSKFTEDPEMLKLGGDQVYRQWLINSFEKENKCFVISRNGKGEVNGFLLHSYTESACIVELIAVSHIEVNSGIGTSLFKAVEHSASKLGFMEIRAGTQVRNANAINFYHKVGCNQVGCHQVYHLWNP